MKVVQGIYSGVTTRELDQLAAETCENRAPRLIAGLQLVVRQQMGSNGGITAGYADTGPGGPWPRCCRLLMGCVHRLAVLDRLRRHVSGVPQTGGDTSGRDGDSLTDDNSPLSAPPPPRFVQAPTAARTTPTGPSWLRALP